MRIRTLLALMGGAVALAAPAAHATPAPGPPARPPAPAAKAAGPPPAASAASAAPAAPAASASPSAPAAPAGGPAAGSAVFFAIDGDEDGGGPLALVPLSCYDARTRQLGAGAACLDLVPAGATAMTDHGPVKVGARAAPRCKSAPESPGLRVAVTGPVPGGAPTYAVWPSAEAARLQVLPDKNVDATMSAVEGLLRAAIRQGSGQRAADIGVYQIALLDMDGDGKRERLYSATLPDRRGRTLWSGLFVGDAYGKSARVVSEDKLERPGDHSMRVLGAMDLDRDGRLELWVSTAGTGIDRASVRRYDGSALQLVATYTSCTAER